MDIPKIIQKSRQIYYMTVSFDGEYISANEYFLERFDCYGLIDKTISVSDTIVEEDWEKVQHVFRQCIKEPNKPYRVYIRKPLPSGEIVDTNWEFLADPSTKEIHCSGFDVSQKMRLERDLIRFNITLEEILDGITDGCYVLDKNWKFTLVNKVFLNTVQRTTEELLGKSIWEVFDADDGFVYPQKYKEAMVTKETQRFEEHYPVLEKWYWVAVYPINEGLLIFFKDITERKLESDLLFDTTRKLNAIMNSTSEAHILLAPDYKVLSFNKTAHSNTKNLYGHDLAHGDNFLKFTSDETVEQFKGDFKTALSGETTKSEVLLNFSNGEQKWFRIEQSPAIDDEGKIIGVVFNSMDIDELKAYEISLKESNERLRAIAYKQSHEVRSPVARILGLIDILKKSPTDQIVMDHIIEVTKELDKVIHDIVRKTEVA